MELLQDLADFLKIDIKDEQSVDHIFLVTLKYLDKIKVQDFEYELMIPLRGVLNKFSNCADFHGVEDMELNEAVNEFIDVVNKTTYVPNEAADPAGAFKNIFGGQQKKNPINETNAPIFQKFQQLYNALIATYNLVKDGKPKSRDLELEGFYNPNNSNKEKAKKLIIEARNQIDRNNSLSEKAKKAITDFITKALVEFEKPNSNWTLIFGRLKEVNSVLSALVSLAIGIKGADTISLAMQKIDEAVMGIDQTSVNINYKTMNHIFDIEEGNLMIDSPTPKLLIETEEDLQKIIEAPKREAKVETEESDE